MNLSNSIDKIQFLNELDKNDIDLNNLSYYLNIAKKDFTITIFSKIIEQMVTLDNKISVSFEFIDSNDWDYINSKYETPSDEFLDIKSKINLFVKSFVELRNEIINVDLSMVLSLFDKFVFKTKTMHIQFLLFDILDNNLKALSFFMSKIEENKKYYCMIFGLLVRYKFEKNIIEKIIDYLMKKEYGFGEFLIVLQGFMYICCFKKEMNDKLGCLIMENKELWGSLNKKVVDRYCTIYNIEKIDFYGVCADILTFFPFDPPCVNEIFELYQDNYLIFTNK
ncbi:hypothetical protein GVAV_003352 [Gurleya vavrai]